VCAQRDVLLRVDGGQWESAGRYGLRIGVGKAAATRRSAGVAPRGRRGRPRCDRIRNPSRTLRHCRCRHRRATSQSWNAKLASNEEASRQILRLRVARQSGARRSDGKCQRSGSGGQHEPSRGVNAGLHSTAAQSNLHEVASAGHDHVPDVTTRPVEGIAAGRGGDTSCDLPRRRACARSRRAPPRAATTSQRNGVEGQRLRAG